MEPIIKTNIPHERITGTIIKLTRPDQGIKDLEVILEVWPRPNGIVVTAAKPYDLHSLSDRAKRIAEYGALSQQEFDRHFCASK